MKLPSKLALHGRYRYEAEIGEGGGGRVVRAADTLSGKSVALKLVPPEALGLLRAEEDALRTLSGEGVAQVLELVRLNQPLPAPWSLAAGTGVLVEELVEGTRSDEVFAGLETEARVEAFWPLAIGVSLALSRVHAAGVIHGDIKPANIVATGLAASLVDFGLAGPPRSSSPHVSGTIGFLAPECLFGERTAATDLYALGQTFRCWLADDSGPLEATVPDALRTLVASLVEEDAALRPASAHDVAQALSQASGRDRLGAPPKMPPELALQLPFCGHEVALQELLGALTKGGLICVHGPAGAGKTRLISETVRRLQRSGAESGESVTFVANASAEHLPRSPYVAEAGDTTFEAARRALRAAAIDGQAAAWVFERAELTEERDVLNVSLGPLSNDEFDKLFASAAARSGGALRASKRIEAQRRSGRLSGRLCRLLADGLGRSEKRECRGPGQLVPSAAEDVAQRLALAGGRLSAEALGDASAALSRLASEGLAIVSADGQWHLRDDLVPEVCDAMPTKRRKALAAKLVGATRRQRAHLAAHRNEEGAPELFERAMSHAYDLGRTSDVERLSVDAERLGASSPAQVRVLFAARVSAGRYSSALLCAEPSEVPEVLRRAGRRDEAQAKLATLGEDPSLAYTRAWLAFGDGALDEAERFTDAATGVHRAELLAWFAFQRGNRREAQAIVRDALGQTSIRQRARLLIVLGIVSNPRDAASAYVEGIGLARSCGERHVEASLMGNLGAARLSLGQLGPALDSLRNAAHTLTELGRERDVGRALHNLARAEMLIGNLGSAAIHLTQGLGASRAATDLEGVEMLEEAQAELAAHHGDLGVARRLSLQSETARLRLAAAIAGSAPDMVEKLLSQSEPGGLDYALADLRRNAAQGVDVAPALQKLRSRETLSWEDALRVAIVLSEHGDSSAGSKARTLLDLAASTLSAPERERMRRLPSYARVLSAAPSDAAVQDSRRWRRLTRVARRLTALEHIDAITKALSESALELVDGERACVVERLASGELRVVAEAGVVRGASAVSRSVVSRALDSGHAVSTMDALSDEHFGAASIHALALRSLLCVPIPRRASVIYIEDRLRPAAFNAEDTALLVDLADLGATGLERCERETTLRVQASELRGMRRSLEERASRQEVELQSQRASPPGFVAESVAMKKVLALAARVASANVPTLIRGESGSGKEHIARYVHAMSARAGAPFISQSCGSIPDALMESLLFGHERGSFTGAESTRVGLFEAADGGTLFLDELGEMSPSLQAALLRVAQDGVVRRVGATDSLQVDVRLITATHQDIAKRIEEGSFRQDLYYRLAVVTIDVPPLRERRGDIAPLVDAWLHAQSGAFTVHQDALDALSAGSWPGNVRQLQNELERARVLADDVIKLEHLSPELRGAGSKSSHLRSQVDALEARLVKDALVRNNGNVTRSAADLGLSRYGLQKMMKRLGIQR
ncbi:MAG: DNA-binding NtrC family response regulator [Polyangiales bacterium]|jgi:DNA-binding NtrC family response regulator